MTYEERELGEWLSAALDDPKACEEFKEAIRAWFESIEERESNQSLQDKDDNIRRD